MLGTPKQSFAKGAASVEMGSKRTCGSATKYLISKKFQCRLQVVQHERLLLSEFHSFRRSEKKYIPEHGHEPALWCAGNKFQSTEQGFNGPLARSPQSRHHSFCLVRPTSLTVAVNLSPSPKSATNFPCLAGEPFLAGQIGV